MDLKTRKNNHSRNKLNYMNFYSLFFSLSLPHLSFLSLALSPSLSLQRANLIFPMPFRINTNVVAKVTPRKSLIIFPFLMMKQRPKMLRTLSLATKTISDCTHTSSEIYCRYYSRDTSPTKQHCLYVHSIQSNGSRRLEMSECRYQQHTQGAKQSYCIRIQETTINYYGMRRHTISPALARQRLGTILKETATCS